MTATPLIHSSPGLAWGTPMPAARHAAVLDSVIAANVRKLERERRREWQAAYDAWLDDMTREHRIEVERREEKWQDVHSLLEP